MLTILEEDEYYNGGSLSYGGGGAPDNFAGWMMNWNYTDAQSKVNGVTVAPVIRVAEQAYGRPWTRMAPPHGVFTHTFADKVNDSRYDGTFTTVCIVEIGQPMVPIGMQWKTPTE